MKIVNILIACACVIACRAEAYSGFTANQKFQVVEKQYLCSTYFEIDTHESEIPKVVKSAFRLRTNYDVYSPKNVFEAVGIVSVKPMSLLTTCGTDIYVYDPDGGNIGMIDGRELTTAAAKYVFWNDKDEEIAVAYLDRTISGFTIYDFKNPNYRIATLVREYTQDQVDRWNGTIYDPNAIDPRLLKVFAAFAVDYQEYFKEDR